MEFIIALLVSLVFCVLSFASEVTSGNIVHLKNGREPNAGAAIIPTIVIVPLMFLIVTWIGFKLIPEYAAWILWALFGVFMFSWTKAFLGQRRVIAELLKKRQSEQDVPPNA
jgi:accessory gene regulator protein AgrB